MGLDSRFLDRHYIINALVIVSYFVLRLRVKCPDLQRLDSYLGLTRVSVLNGWSSGSDGLPASPYPSPRRKRRFWARSA
jgi:hypothetical protein